MNTLNSFDSSIIQFMNGFAHQWRFHDMCLGCLQFNDLFKGGVIITLFWWLWFKKEGRVVREYVLTTIFASFGGLVIARLLAVLLPYRERPMYNEALNFIPPDGAGPAGLESWSSFPSDHAVFFFALATGITMVSRRVGVAAFLYTIFAISLPRIYFGLHYPTDILAGAVLGVGSGSVVAIRAMRERVSHYFLEWERKYPELFYPAFFVISFQMVILFYHVREFGHRLLNLL